MTLAPPASLAINWALCTGSTEQGWVQAQIGSSSEDVPQQTLHRRIRHRVRAQVGRQRPRQRPRRCRHGRHGRPAGGLRPARGAPQHVHHPDEIEDLRPALPGHLACHQARPGDPATPVHDRPVRSACAAALRPAAGVPSCALQAAAGACRARRRADTQLIFIDPEDGRLKYSNSPGIDNFDCEARWPQARALMRCRAALVERAPLPRRETRWTSWRLWTLTRCARSALRYEVSPAARSTCLPGRRPPLAGCKRAPGHCAEVRRHLNAARLARPPTPQHAPPAPVTAFPPPPPETAGLGQSALPPLPPAPQLDMPDMGQHTPPAGKEAVALGRSTPVAGKGAVVLSRSTPAAG